MALPLPGGWVCHLVPLSPSKSDMVTRRPKLVTDSLSKVSLAGLICSRWTLQPKKLSRIKTKMLAISPNWQWRIHSFYDLDFLLYFSNISHFQNKENHLKEEIFKCSPLSCNCISLHFLIWSSLWQRLILFDASMSHRPWTRNQAWLINGECDAQRRRVIGQNRTAVDGQVARSPCVCLCLSPHQALESMLLSWYAFISLFVCLLR